MKRAVVILVLLGLTSCHSKRAKYAAAAAAIAGGSYLVAVAPPHDNCNDDPADPLGIGAAACGLGQGIRVSFLVTGILAIASGLIAVAVIARPAPIPLDDRIVTRLTAQAALAARSGDCASVRVLVERIARRHAEVAIDDPAIERCMR